MRMTAGTGIFPVLFLRRVLRAAAVLAISVPSTLHGQFAVRAWLDWRTVETAHFVFHYPADLEDWTRAVASRAEAIDSAVARTVGQAPAAKTQIVVDDPYQVPNGSAWPFLNQPLINLWATPPNPRDDIGEFQNWGEMLLSHEFTHIAHLTRPSRNTLTRLLWQALPVDLGPVAIRAPRWVIEGYATLVEGSVSGSGRPHGAWRASFLRQWALEGQLPRYEQLDSGGGYEGGEFAYLAGSAFLEWLVERKGDSSLVQTWRRLTARQDRSFDEAFSGVFGESARALYGRFSAELTGKALDVQRKMRAASGPDTSIVVQRLAWETGDPSISHDGTRAALVLRSATAPSRVVVWSTALEPDTGKARRDSAMLRRDPEDVPAKPIYPPPKKQIATLRARGGGSYASPRFLRDGRVLLWRNTAQGDGSLRPDLYLWSPDHGGVRRITHGASIRDADPRPDGRSAIATRCHGGWCDVVAVNLIDGSYTTLLPGSPTRSFYRPRVSPDGGRLLVSVHEGRGWRLAIGNLSSPHLSPAGPLSGNVYDGEWIDSTTLVAVWDGDGIPNLQSIDLKQNTTRPLTWLTGAAVAPAPNSVDGTIWFLSLQSRGYDVRRVSRAPFGAIATQASRDTSDIPAMPLAPTRLTEFAENATSAPRSFGLTSRLFRWIPQPEADADGFSGALALTSSDVIARSELIANVAFGDAASWRGAAASATWRGTRPSIRLEAFGAEQRPSATRSGVPPSVNLDSRLTGGQISLDGTRQYDAWATRFRIGAGLAQIHEFELPQAGASGETRLENVARRSRRAMVFGHGAAAWTQRGDAINVTETVGGNVTVGQSFDAHFARGVATAGFSVSGPGAIPIAATALYGRVNAGADSYEMFALGGGPSALLDGAQLTQRVGMPVLPTGSAIGPTLFAYRVTLLAQPLSPYFWAGATAGVDQRFAIWHRVVGLDWSQSIGAIPLAGTPSARGVIGIGESLDAPFRHRVRAYVSLVLNP